jgi:rod shape-determining protein MreD
MQGSLARSLERTEVHRYPVWAMILVPLLALSIQTRLVVSYPNASALDLALLVTVYFASNRRNQIVGLLLGAAIGLAQDALSGGFIGVNGIVKTLIGYIASSLGAQIDVTHPLMRGILVFVSYYVHMAIYFVLVRVLLDRPMAMLRWGGLGWALVNATVGVILFDVLDHLRIKE